MRHWLRNMVLVKVMYNKTMHKPEVSKRFWSKVYNANNGCLEFNPNGRTKRYGTFYDGHQKMSAHRFVFIDTIGKIPDRMFVCHTCDNKQCVSPEHLYLGTNHDNQKDAVERGQHRTNPHNAKKTGCPYGHSYDNINSRGDRVCTICLYHRAKEYQQRRRVLQFASQSGH